MKKINTLNKGKFRLSCRLKKIFITCLFYFAIGGIWAQDFAWAISMGGSGADHSWQLDVDAMGNTYVTGQFNRAADFDPGPDTAMLTPTGTAADIFLAKYDVNGNYVWAKGIGAGSPDQGKAVAVDSVGNVYVTGYFNGSVDFDPGGNGATLVATHGADVYLAKYDTNGNYLWAKSMGGTGNDDAYGIAVDDFGNVYVTGVFGYFAGGTADFNPGGTGGTLTSAGGNDIFLAKYDANGNYLWAKSMGGDRAEIPQGVAADGSGNVYITGQFISSQAEFNPTGSGGTLTNAGRDDIFLAKYDPNGNYVWARSMGSPASDLGLGIAVDCNDNVYVTGYINESVDFGVNGSGVLPPPQYGTDAFLAKYNSNGDYLWAKSTRGMGFALAHDLAVDGRGNVYMTGYFGGSVDFDFGPDTAIYTSTSLYANLFIAKYDPNGNYFWVKGMEGERAKYSNSIAVDSLGNAYATGYFNGSVDFNPGGSGSILTSVGDADIFVIKLASNDTTPLSSYLSVTECADSYILHGETYTTSGTYIQHFPNTAGCDSSVILDLTLYPLDKPVVNVDEFELGVSGTYATYQWIRDGIDIPGATHSTYTVTENGNYSVRVTDENGCEITSDVYPVTNVSIEEINRIGVYIHVYPNPAHDILHINSPIDIEVSLTSLDGRKLLQEINPHSIPVKDLVKGIYLLHFMDKDGRLIKVEKVAIY